MKDELRVVYGICGIGNGHTKRSEPIIEALVDSGALVAIFAYGCSYTHFSAKYRSNSRVRVFEVEVPYLPGDAEGLDFAAAALLPRVSDPSISLQAMAGAQAFLGRPTFVVSDYEPQAAQYAYAYDSPLFTVDQQSKFLMDGFEGILAGTTCLDERMRLRMFFPKAEKRIVCSFFRLKEGESSESIQLCSPVIRPEVRALSACEQRETGTHMVMYVSPQGTGGLDELAVKTACMAAPEREFHLFTSKNGEYSDEPNLVVHRQGGDEFLPLLASCAGLITTAGHTLLSEAMYLSVPVLAVPLPLFEQQLNAAVVADNGFGLAVARLDSETVKDFISRIPEYRCAIRDDRSVLLRGDGCAEVIEMLRLLF